MILRTDMPEPQLVLRLQSHGPTVVLLAQIAGSEDAEQEIMRFETGGIPSQGDPLGQRNDRLVAFTRKVRHDFPIEVDGHGHMVVRMKA
jgi:hypothetical protein